MERSYFFRKTQRRRVYDVIKRENHILRAILEAKKSKLIMLESFSWFLG